MPVVALQSAPFYGGGFFYPKNGKSRLFQDFSMPAPKEFGKTGGFATASGALSFLLAAWLGFSASPASALPLAPGQHLQDQGQSAIPETLESAAGAISGSRYPGVLDHLLILPANPEEENPALRVHINYPSIGQQRVDTDIRAWVTNLAEIFATHLQALDTGGLALDSGAEPDAFLHDDDLISGLEDRTYELWGDYTITNPSDKALSVTFEIWNYTGNPQGALDIMTLNYNLANGQRLELVDIFENPDEALLLMSNFSRRQLERRLGAAGRSRMAMDGTEPLAENFSSLTLTKEGISVNFQPWQVAPWEAGIQKVEIPLTELLAAGPLLALWDK